MNNDKFNGSRCKDLTAYQALNNIDEERKVKKLILTIFYIVSLAGYEVEGRIALRNKRTGKLWR